MATALSQRRLEYPLPAACHAFDGGRTLRTRVLPLEQPSNGTGLALAYQLALSCLPRSLSRLALCQYDQLNAQLLPRTVTTLQLIDCELPQDLDDSLKNVRQLELQLLMPLNRIFRSSKPELRTLKLDCSLLGRSHEPVLQPLLPLSAEYLPCLEYLELCNVGIPKGNFALHLSSLCIQLSEFSSLRRVEISAYVPAPEWVSGVPRLVSSIRSSLPAGCAFLVHALADPG
ncbi:hypothetical protein WJX84_005764 [Apatococcus fuscideae]|uniref:Uncharacterized protein n=1 Tax=Apatococcus fuscideae TaxID=2026836 RepID=A0AAW1T5F4_9CHLO